MRTPAGLLAALSTLHPQTPNTGLLHPILPTPEATHVGNGKNGVKSDPVLVEGDTDSTWQQSLWGLTASVLCPQAMFISINAMLIGVWVLLLLASLLPLCLCCWRRCRRKEVSP